MSWSYFDSICPVCGDLFKNHEESFQFYCSVLCSHKEVSKVCQHDYDEELCIYCEKEREKNNDNKS